MAFGFTMKIPSSAYKKALSKVQRENRSYRGKRSKSASAKRYATNRDRAVVEFYRFQNRKKSAPFVAYKKGDKLTNFTGLKLCTITRHTGSKGVTARCIDGHTYVGRSNGEGMWIRMRPKIGR